MGGEDWNISCHIKKQKCHSHHNSSPPGHSGRRIILTSTAIRLLSLLTENPEKLRMWKYRTLSPGSWDDCERNDLVSTVLHLPIHRKALYSLTQNILFSLIHNILLMFRLPALCYKHILLYNLTPSNLSPPSPTPTPHQPPCHPHPWDSSLRVTWDAIS